MPVNSNIQDNTRERRTECAKEALKGKEISSIRKAASIYRVNYCTSLWSKSVVLDTVFRFSGVRSIEIVRCEVHRTQKLLINASRSFLVGCTMVLMFLLHLRCVQPMYDLQLFSLRMAKV